MSLVDEVVDAHGGLHRWRQAAAVRLRLSSGGLAFATKGQGSTLHDVTATVATRGQDVTLEAPTWSFRFDSQIPRPRGLRWSTEDVAAFAACALWTYVALPFLLPELDVEEPGTGWWCGSRPNCGPTRPPRSSTSTTTRSSANGKSRRSGQSETAMTIPIDGSVRQAVADDALVAWAAKGEAKGIPAAVRHLADDSRQPSPPRHDRLPPAQGPPMTTFRPPLPADVL